MSGKNTTWRLATATFAATLLASLPLVLGFFGASHPALDSFGHFRVHLAVLCGLASLALLATSFWKQGLLALALSAAALWTTLSAFPIGSPVITAKADPARHAVYRLLQLNVRFDNAMPGRVLSLIGRVRPDVVTLNEVSLVWRNEIAKISAMYPYQHVCAAPRPVGGVAILSRRPFRPETTARCLGEGSLGLAAIDFGGPVLQVASMHLTWPWPFEQAAQLDTLQPSLAALGTTALLAGDLNAATWSATTRRVESDAGMTHVAGIGPTWLDRRFPDLLRPYVGLPIDQVLSKGDVEVVSAKTLEAVGSDHLPILVEFRFGGEPREDPETATAMLSASR